MARKFLVGLILLLPSLAFAIPPGEVNYMPMCTIAQRNTCGGGPEPGRHIWVIDGQGPLDCTVGGGTDQHICVRGADNAFFPIASTGGGEAAVYDLCRSGAPGIGFDPVTKTYGVACGNYNWSSVTGGVDGDGVFSLTTAVCPGGCAEWVTCTGEARGIKDGSILEQDVRPCRVAGTRLKYNANADLILAIDQVRPGPGCKVYMPAQADGNAIIYHKAGCGRKLDGTPNACPVMRPPHDTHRVRSLTVRADREICWEGRDLDGIVDKGPGNTRPVMEGAWFLNDQGPGVDFSAVSSLQGDDPNGDGEDISQDGMLSFGPTLVPQQCAPVSASDPRCRAGTILTFHPMSAAAYGRAWTASEVVSDNTNHRICITDGNTQTGNAGLCTGDRRVVCTIDTDCSNRGLGDCDTLAEALVEDMKVGNKEYLARVSFNPDCNDESADISANQCTRNKNILARPDPNNVSTTCGANGFYLSFAAVDTLGDAANSGWPMELTRTTPTTNPITVSIIRPEDVIYNGTVLEGGTFTEESPFGRIANDSNKDTLSSGTVSSGTATTLTVSGTPWTVNAYVGMTVILRPSALLEIQGCTSNCQEARTVLSNTNNTLTIASQQPNWTTNPAGGNTFRLSDASCPYPAFVGAMVSSACDATIGFQTNTAIGIRARNFSVHHGHLSDTAAAGYPVDYDDFIWSGYQGYVNTDSGGVRMHRCLIRNNRIKGDKSLINTSFGLGGVIEDCEISDNNEFTGALIHTGGSDTVIKDNVFRNNAAEQIIWIDGGKNQKVIGNRFIGNTGPGIVITGSTATPNSLDPTRDIQILDNWAIGPEYSNTTAPGSTGASFGMFSAFITITNFGGGSGSTWDGNMGRILIKGNQMTMQHNGANQPCLIGLDIATGDLMAGDANNWVIEDNSIENRDAGTTCTANVNRAVCARDSAGGGLSFAGTDTGVFTMDPPPIMRNNKANNCAQADQPYVFGPAATLPLCVAGQSTGPGNVGEGFVIGVTDDNNTCRDDVAGTLTGGGTDATICLCSNGAWVRL